MEKTVGIKINELKNDLVQVLNKAQLPYYIIEPILKEFYETCKENSIEQIKQEQLAYNQEMLEESDEASDSV